MHSYLYYECDNNILTDKEYDSKCRELVSYKSAYPELWKASKQRRIVTPKCGRF